VSHEPEPQSIPVVCNTGILAGKQAPPDGAVDLLIELPHGATKLLHYESVRGLLCDRYPDELTEFFHVNTDVGTPEAGVSIARALLKKRPEMRIRILRSLIPRTFIDCNREPLAKSDRGAGVTAQLPDYVRDERDIATLTAYHDAYVEQAEKAYAEVCGNGGLSLILHSYAPRSVAISHVDDSIVTQLRHAWSAGKAESWPRRPDVDVITTPPGGSSLAPDGFVAQLRLAYGEIDVEVEENHTYELHPGTLGHRWSARFPGQALCVELNRERLVEKWLPLQPLSVDAAAVAKMTAPLMQTLDKMLRPAPA
jgi:hypothetical protein